MEYDRFVEAKHRIIFPNFYYSRNGGGGVGKIFTINIVGFPHFVSNINLNRLKKKNG